MKNLSHAELVSVAKSAAAPVLAGYKKLTDDAVAYATAKAFNAICAADRAAGTSDHKCAAFAHGVYAVAAEGVTAAKFTWKARK